MIWIGSTGFTLFEAEQVPCGPINSIAEIFADPQYAARENIKFVRDPRIGEIAHSIPNTLEETYRKAAACDQQRRRRLAVEKMRSKGILVMETDPAHWSIHLVKRYLEIRQADLQ